MPSHIKFHQINRAADIEITFAAIDGRGNVLAGTYLPIDGGDVTFDLSENWKIGVSRKGYLYIVTILPCTV